MSYVDCLHIHAHYTECDGGKILCILVPLLLLTLVLSCFRRQWVREEDLAKDLKLHSKQLRRTLRFFEEEKLVTRDHRREVCPGFSSLLSVLCF